MNAFDRRQAAIEFIIRMWIGGYGEGFDTGALVEDAHFPTLRTQVEELRPLSRKESWQAGVDKWISYIDYAEREFFTTELGLLDDEWTPGQRESKASEFTDTTRREFFRLFKWSVLEGSSRVYNL